MSVPYCYLPLYVFCGRRLLAAKLRPSNIDGAAGAVGEVGRIVAQNRIRECQADLFADRTSSATLRANQLRLWFASMAYVLLCALRRIGLAHTEFANATCATLRLKLLKIGAQVTISVRRIKIAMASAHPWRQEWALAHARPARLRTPRPARFINTGEQAATPPGPKAGDAPCRLRQAHHTIRTHSKITPSPNASVRDAG